MNRRWTLGGWVLVLAMLAASDAHASRAYVPSEQDACGTPTMTCCKKSASGNQIGAFGLENISADKAPAQRCSLVAGSCTHTPKCPVHQVIGGVGEIVSGPVILAGALVKDAYLILTMPYRPSEPLN